MNGKRNSGQEQERSDATAPSAPERSINGTKTEVHPDQELTYRIKSAIDQRGRYSFRLADMTAAFASGRGVSNTAARRTIEDRFTEQLGLSPQEYLDRHYDQRREQGQDVSRSRQREKGQDRGR